MKDEGRGKMGEKGERTKAQGEKAWRLGGLKVKNSLCASVWFCLPNEIFCSLFHRGGEKNKEMAGKVGGERRKAKGKRRTTNNSQRPAYETP
jgi:hypothetical protein